MELTLARATPSTQLLIRQTHTHTHKQQEQQTEVSGKMYIKIPVNFLYCLMLKMNVSSIKDTMKADILIAKMKAEA